MSDMDTPEDIMGFDKTYSKVEKDLQDQIYGLHKRIDELQKMIAKGDDLAYHREKGGLDG